MSVNYPKDFEDLVWKKECKIAINNFDTDYMFEMIII